MKATELAQLGLKELRALRDKVENAISAREQQDRAEVKAKLADLAAKAGFNVGELFGTARAKRGPAPVKYRNPSDTSQTWTGRGRRPRWMADAGGNIERFRI
jgi:DNA-binding protein H-NS